MAKILVADDNSNIQKMVGLALKDQGIEVVAVGNGEAAVRKISDVRPDVVLADVFMPVRNGYEVCEFIKKNEKLSHIPVILLVGAFDPLDEQEAQRVGADGVLKKPFVPADPLISMVKSALARGAADTRVRVSLDAPERVPSSTVAPVISSFPSPAAEFSSPEAESSFPTQPPGEASVRPQPFSIEEGHSPLAFGSLLDAATSEKQEETDESFMPVSHPKLVEERKWGTPAAEEEEEEAKETPSWRSGIEEFFDSPAVAATRAPSDWRDEVLNAPPQDAAPEAEASPTIVGATPVEEAESSPVSPPPEPPIAYWQGEQTRADAEPAPVEDAEAEPQPAELVSQPSSFTPENFPGLFVEEKTVGVPESPEATQEPLVEQEFTPPASSTGNWEEEVRRAARLVATWETPSAPPQNASPSSEFTSPISEISPAWPEPQPAESPASSSEPPAGDAATASSDETQRPSHPSTVSEAAPAAQFDSPEWYRKFQVTPAQEEPREAAPAPAAAEPVQAPDMEALVARVLEKMSPNALQQVTREILKPMIEALVRNELDKNK